MRTNKKRTVMIDAIDAYKDESLYSYLGRYMTLMGMSDDSEDFSEFIHGTARIKTPSLYLADNLDHIANKINLPDSESLGSGKCILNHMTTFPFYKFFFDESTVKRYEEELMEDTYNVNAYCRKLKIFTHKHQIERQHIIKYCPDCMKHHTYLKQEHAVIGNYACWEHGISLLYIHVPKTSQKPLRYADYIPVLEMNYSQGIECISQEDVPLFTVVAKYVHDIFLGNWDRYSLNDIKKVIYAALCERNLVKEDGIDVDELEKEFLIARPLILNCLVRDSMIDNVIYTKDTITGERIQPIFYIYLLALFYPNSDELYRRIQSSELQEIEESLSMIAASRVDEDRREIVGQEIASRFNDEFALVSFVEKRYGYAVIQHEICGDERPRNIYNFLKGKGYCPVCKSYSIPRHDMNEIQQKYRDKLLDYAGPVFVIDEFFEKGYVMIKHTVCGHSQKVLIKDFLNQKRCKGCGQIISSL